MASSEVSQPTPNGTVHALDAGRDARPTLKAPEKRDLESPHGPMIG